MRKKRILSGISISLTVCFVLMMSAYAYAVPSWKMKGQLPPGLAKKVDYVVSQGIMKGDGQGNLALQDNVKRADITVMIVRAFKLSAVLKGNFPDVETNSYYYNAIATAKSLGIAKGDGKRFHPKQFVTLEQAIALIERSASVANANVVIKRTELNDLYSKEDLSRFATRKDIADMLYYVLTGDTSENGTGVLEAINYTTNEDTALTLVVDNFKPVFKNATEKELSYVTFTLPDAQAGKLYYDYKSATDYASLVTAETKYYADSAADSLIGKVAFVPAADYDGKVSIAYTAYDADGKSYAGTMAITVTDIDTVLDIISYTTNKDSAITFAAANFSETFKEVTGKDLAYVMFKLPDAASGKLFYDYTSATDYQSQVSATTKYYVDPASGSSIAKVTFVPYSTADATVLIEYTAYTADSGPYNGTVKVLVDAD